MRVVVVNYNGGDLTRRCVDALLATEYPSGCLELVMVDNASTDGVSGTLAREHPDVRVIASPTNLGFAGGCNLGMRNRAGVDFVALVNPDAVVSPGWLSPLVDRLTRDPGLGAACPKIVLGSAYRELTISSADRPRSRRGQVRVSGVRLDGTDLWSRVRFMAGFSGPDGAGRATGRWTTDRTASLLVPELGEGATSNLELELAGCQPGPVTVSSSGASSERMLTADRAWYAVPLESHAIDRINSTGVLLTDDEFGADRGYLEPDDGRYAEEDEPWGWSGAAVLLRAAYLDDIGDFDERLFLYYEDLELSWRGQARGWRYGYTPGSLVRHVHAATTGADSSLGAYYNDRNRLVVLLRHASFDVVARALLRHLLTTASYARRDLMDRLGRACVPEVGRSRSRIRAFGGFVRLVPHIVIARIHDRHRPGREGAGD